MYWKGKLFCSVHLYWDYKNRMVWLSMPQYARNALLKFGHKKPSEPQHAPYPAAPIQYVSKQQNVQTDTSPPLSPEQIKFLQQVVGTFIYFGNAVDPTLAAALSVIAPRQSKGTEATMQATRQLLDYIPTHPNPSIVYLVSDMILALDTNGFYLSELGGKSRAAVYIFLTKKGNPDFHNRAVRVLSCHGLRVRNRDSLALLWLQGGHPPTRHTQGNGAPTAWSNSRHHRRFHCRRTHH